MPTNPFARPAQPAPPARASWLWLVLVGLLALLAPGVPATAHAGAEPDAWWGQVELPGGQTLRFAVRFTAYKGKTGAELDIPAQGVAGAPLHDVAADETSARFVFRTGPNENTWARFEMRRRDDTALGTMQQAGQRFPVAMRRGPIGEGALPSTAAPREGESAWTGSIELAPGQSLGFTAYLRQDAGAWAGELDIPAQGVARQPLEGVSASDAAIGFTLVNPGPASLNAVFRLDTRPDGTAAGTMLQAGTTYRVTARRLQAGESASGLDRPQHPRPPFPYTQRDVTFPGGGPGVMIAGTLTLPEGKGPHPCVVLISGSGQQDRDETIAGHKPFWVIADHLSRRGVAVLRYDDRGVGGSTGDPSSSTTVDFAADARGAVEFLKTVPEVDAGRVGLVGHSEGGLIAPMVAADRDDVAFVVLLAGTGVPGADILRRQIPATAAAAGLPAEFLSTLPELCERALRAIVGNAPRDEVRGALRELIRAQSGGMIDDASLEGTVAQFDSPWFRTFLTLDPREFLARVRCPVLALNGALDTQVIHDQNLPEIEKALARAGNRDVTVRVLPGLNHLFQTATTGAMTEYPVIRETFAPAALDEMTAWLRARAGLER